MSTPDAKRVVAFWFNRPPLEWLIAPKGLDEQMASEFGDLVLQARRSELDDWANDGPESSLALVALLDQFSRNLFRGSADAWSADAKAHEVATKAIARDFDKKVTVIQASALYLPLMQQESLISLVAARCLFEALKARCVNEEEHQWVDMGIAASKKHLQLLQQFGRYPTRNALLGRHNTEAEEEFLKEYVPSLSSFIIISMAPRTRAKRKRNSASTLHPSVDADVRPLSNGDNLSGNHESKSISLTANDLQSEAMETPAPQSYALVLGEQMLIPQTYDPDTYDPDGRMPWTPEPEPYNPDSYAAWGRRHFGEEWYTVRKNMLEERNIYLQYDRVYKERQRALRITEHKVEGRPFEPGLRSGEMLDTGWKRLWARLSKDLGIPSSPASPIPSKDNDDSDTDLSGYNTYAPTPESREPTPIPADPWERLQYNRRRFNWDEERYQFERILLKEALIDGTRSLRENEDGDRQAREKQEAMEGFRYSDPSRFSLDKSHFQAHIDLPKKGWTREQIDAEYEADVAIHEWRKKNPEPKGSGLYGSAVTPEDKAALDIWCQKLNAAKIRFYGELPPKGSGPFGFSATQEDKDAMEIWRKGIYARVSRQQQREAQAGAIDDALAPEEALKLRVSPRQTNILRQTRSGRISKDTRTRASPSDRGRGQSNPDMLKSLGNNIPTATRRRNRQRKTYEKERSSRRLAGQPPEYGMLERGETQPSLRQPSKTRHTSRSGTCSGNMSKKPTAARNEKPPRILKSRQTGTGHPKRQAKGSKG